MSAESTQHGEVFLDTRGQGRAMRLTWHHEADVVVLSLWRDKFCAGTFRLSTADVNDFVDALVDGLRDTPPEVLSATSSSAVVAHTGAIDVMAPAHAADLYSAGSDDDSDDDDADAPGGQVEVGGFVEWAMRDQDGRASA